MTKDLPVAVRRPGLLSRWVRSWNEFWFTPADPTVLGCIRLFVGLVVFYIHLSYTVDLQELMGANAWVDLPTVNTFRYDLPIQAQRFDWFGEDPYAKPPDPTPSMLQKPSPEEEAYAREFHIDPRVLYSRGFYSSSIWFHVTDPRWMLVVHSLILTIIFLFAIGFCTRLTSVLTWMGAIFYIQRAPTSLFGMDTMMNLLLIYLMIGPSGAAVSVDRLIERYWLTRQALRQRRPVPLALRPAPRISANLALHCIQVNLCIIYLASGLSKLMGNAWWKGTAVWGTLSNAEFSPLYFPPFYAALQFLCAHRLLWELFITGSCAFTLAVEIGFPFLVWNRSFRPAMLVGAVMLHTGIALFMGLNTFSLLMIAMLFSFIPTEVVQASLAQLGRNAPQLRLLFDSRVRRQRRAASLVHALDAWDQVDLEDQSPTSRGRIAVNETVESASPMEVRTDTGTVDTGYPAFQCLLRSLRLLRPVSLVTYIPGVPQLGKALYPGKPPHEPALAAATPVSRETPVGR